MLLLGNEAIVRGALEAGISFATCYPGTPSSEIPLNFFPISKETDLYFEYSTNEKVAMEVAAGAAISGLRTMVTMKHVGLNVAADPLMTLAYTGVTGGMVIINADDPSLFSSQNEQDNRYYARLSGCPMLEPTNPQEMKEITKYAFDLSEQLQLPVFVRTTTRLAHVSGAVALGELKPGKKVGHFDKNPMRFVTVPAVSRGLHVKLLEKYNKAQEISSTCPYNEIIGNGKWGLVGSGSAFGYLRDAVRDLGIEDKVSILKLGMTWPLPKDLILKFLKQVDKVLVVEELEPLNETEIRGLAQENGITLEIKGKGVGGFSRLFEYDPGMVRQTVAGYFGVPYTPPKPLDLSGIPELPGRPPNLCAGCPHRATYYAVKQVYGKDGVFPTDIGCYTLGLLKPIEMADFVICMGSSVSSACGISRATDQKVCSFIGDSTFFHSGITGLIDAIHHNHKFTMVILDNGTTAMTGHQPHPGIDPAVIGWGAELTHISIEDLVRGLGVKDIHVVKPFSLKKTIAAVQASKDYDGLSVIISQEICPLFAKATKQFKVTRPFTINPDKCKNHRDCLNLLACPAMYLEGESVKIDPVLCIGCSVCAQVCPENAIQRTKE